MAKTRTIITQDDLGITICKALGVDHEIVSNVFVRINAGEFGPAEITLIIHADDKVKNIDWKQIIQSASVTVIEKSESAEILTTKEATK